MSTVPAGPKPRARDLVLVVDLGTGGPKIGFASLAGEIRWWTHFPVLTQTAPSGAATQDADEWWRLIGMGVRRAAADGVALEEVVAVAVTGQWASTVPTCEDGTPAGPCVLWSDTRGAPYSRAKVGGRVQGYAGRKLVTWLRHTGGVPSTSGADPLGHLWYLEHEEPEVLARTRWYLEPVDHLAMRFTGLPAATAASMSAAWLTDNRHLDVLEYDDAVLDLVGIDRDKLPPLVPGCSVIGPLRTDVAAAFGLPADAVVVTSTTDLHCAVVASGAVGPFEAHLSIGTTSWISAPVPYKRTDVVRQLGSVPGISEDHYLLANNQESAGRCLEWYRDLFRPGVGFDELAYEAAQAPPGSNGVIFTPWIAGERCPVDDHAARGGFHNLGLATAPGDLTRAVMEGVAYNLNWLLVAAEHYLRRRVDSLRLIGGGARLDVWAQILADVLDRPIERVEHPFLAGLRGSAIYAGLAMGRIERDEVRSLVPVDRVFTPRPEFHDRYAALYAEFPRLYRAQKPMFARLHG